MPCWPVLGSIILPNIGGWAAACPVMRSIKSVDGKPSWYDSLKKPEWTPPNWAFGPAWTVLYSGMGYASYLVYKDCNGFTPEATLPLALYGGQLALNWAWTPIFFHQRKIKCALYEITVLTVAATACTVAFFQVNQTAGYIMLPYLAWLGFATSLNYNIWKNNPEPATVTEIVDEPKKK